jgi:hypothetical protein
VLPIASQGVERRRVTVVVGAPVDLSSWAGRLDRQAQLEASAALLASVQPCATTRRGADGRAILWAGQDPNCSRRRGRISRAAVCIAPRTRSRWLPEPEPVGPTFSGRASP